MTFTDLSFQAHIDSILQERAATMRSFSKDHRHINMYAIYRADLVMEPGKLASQTGHAFTLAYEEAKLRDPAFCQEYKGTGNGTKLVMYAKNERQLLRAYRELLELDIPCALVIDRGHVQPPHFDGNPIITALGIGPVYKDRISHITKRYTLAQ